MPLLKSEFGSDQTFSIFKNPPKSQKVKVRVQKINFFNFFFRNLISFGSPFHVIPARKDRKKNVHPRGGGD